MPGQSNADLADLAARVVDGDRLAFARLAEPIISDLLAIALRMLGSKEEAEDAVQNALASAWIARTRLDPARGLSPFLMTITLNKCRDRLRRRKAAAFLGYGQEHEITIVGDPAPTPDVETGDRQALAATYAEIRKLPVRLQEALVLVAIDGRSQSEAASLLETTEKAIEARVYRARKILRKNLQIN